MSKPIVAEALLHIHRLSNPLSPVGVLTAMEQIFGLASAALPEAERLEAEVAELRKDKERLFKFIGELVIDNSPLTEADIAAGKRIDAAMKQRPSEGEAGAEK